MTTTGLNKFRPLIHSLAPKICLIEEAAEVCEAHIVAALVSSIEHLILIGDHEQLRPQCNVSELAEPEYALNISLFERLINNGIPSEVLSTQRRMIPEIRRLIQPIYGDKLKDHSSVLDRPDVPGMGGVNSFFFTHRFPESQDDLRSWFNMVCFLDEIPRPQSAAGLWR